MKKLFFCMFGWSLATSAYADLISVSETFSSPLTIREHGIFGRDAIPIFGEGSGGYAGINIADRGTITDVNVTIDVENVALDDFVYKLRHRKSPDQSWFDPATKKVTLTLAAAFKQVPGGFRRIRLLFDDSASFKLTRVRGSDPALRAALSAPLESSSVAPIQPLTLFNGEDLSGEWGLFADDDTSHTLHGWGLDITTEDVSPVPLPPSIVMLGIGLLGLGFSGRKKTA